MLGAHRTAIEAGILKTPRLPHPSRDLSIDTLSTSGVRSPGWGKGARFACLAASRGCDRTVGVYVVHDSL